MKKMPQAISSCHCDGLHRLVYCREQKKKMKRQDTSLKNKELVEVAQGLHE